MYEKQQNVIGMVWKAKGEMKKLYFVVNKIIGIDDVNPFPEGNSNEVLSQEFADFFHDKIVRMRRCWKDKVYEHVVLKFTKFAPFTPNQIKSIICNMNTTSCELDPIPTAVLKEILLTVLHVITLMINACLENAVFARHWKSAVVRPLLKKLDNSFLQTLGQWVIYHSDLNC